MKIHRTLGNGFQEVIYQRCLEIELKKSGLSFGREVEQSVGIRISRIRGFSGCNFLLVMKNGDFWMIDKLSVKLSAVNS
jgi:GxxExxY protein